MLSDQKPQDPVNDGVLYFPGHAGAATPRSCGPNPGALPRWNYRGRVTVGRVTVGRVTVGRVTVGRVTVGRVKGILCFVNGFTMWQS